MITSAQEYFSNLDLLYNVNEPVYALLPAAGNVYNIDLNTRSVEAPDTLSIETDHKSKVIYFAVDRFADYMDLSTTRCVVQYNIQGKTRFYPVPFFDIYNKAHEGKIIFPWCLDASVTNKVGTVEFAIHFFKIDTNIKENGQAELVYTYSLNTLPAYSKIVKGIVQHDISDEEEKIEASIQYKNLWNEINNIKENGLNARVYWTILPNDLSDPDVDDTQITQELSEIINNLDFTDK